MLLLVSVLGRELFADLTCTVDTTCPSGVVIFRMSGTDNAHAELSSQSNYSNLVCCSGITNLGNSCTGTFDIALILSDVTNAHVEEDGQINFFEPACISVPTGGTVEVFYDLDCGLTPGAATLASMSGQTNAHVGDAFAGGNKICAIATEAQGETLSFDISDNTIGFGSLSAQNDFFATGDTSGSVTEAEAHTITASTSAGSGYVITVNGNTLTSGGNSVNSIGGTNTASTIGTEQFGLRITASGGNGAVSSPYAAAGFALDTGSFPDQVASDPDGDDDPTIYSVRYVGNISAATEPGTYTSTLTYVITAGF